MSHTRTEEVGPAPFSSFLFKNDPHSRGFVLCGLPVYMETMKKYGKETCKHSKRSLFKCGIRCETPTFFHANIDSHLFLWAVHPQNTHAANSRQAKCHLSYKRDE